MILADFAGAWAGTNGFRLMPNDPLAEFPATLTVTIAAGGHLTSVAYSWQHPEDGPQDGLMVIGSAGGEGSLIAMWADSWHQKPEPMTLSGGHHRAGGTVELSANYAGDWGWRIVFDGTDAENLRMRMENVVPADQAGAEVPAGPYPAMVMNLRRA
jgi:Protein of unknown function (DUF1579)